MAPGPAHWIAGQDRRSPTANYRGAVPEHVVDRHLSSSPEVSAVAAFRSISAALAEEQDLDTFLHLIVTKLPELTAAGRCSMHLLNRDTGLFHAKPRMPTVISTPRSASS